MFEWFYPYSERTTVKQRVPQKIQLKDFALRSIKSTKKIVLKIRQHWGRSKYVCWTITNAQRLYLRISSDLDFEKDNDAAMPNTFNPE